jgi:hypothetical protein
VCIYDVGPGDVVVVPNPVFVRVGEDGGVERGGRGEVRM